jgi:hypothetical protein
MMNSMLPIWLLPFWTMGAPVLWLLFDHLQTQKSTRTHGARPLPADPATPGLAYR